MKTQIFRHFAAGALSIFCSIAGIAHAQPPGTTAAGVVDLSLGPDIYVPWQLAINPGTDRLYVGGYSLYGQNPAIKVIDTATQQIIAGVDLGRYANATNPFLPFAMAVDSSAAPLGNKIYVLGQLEYPRCALRVVDGETNQNLTGEGTDLLLPWMNRQDQSSTGNGASQIVVNPNNHKVYIADGFGKVIVVDGTASPPKVITTLNPDAGSFLVLSPTSNKVFVMGYNAQGQGKPGAVIDSTTDTFTYIATAMPNALAAAFNPANNRVYFSGRVDQRQGIFVLDGSTGELVMENTQDVRWARSLAISPSRNALFTGGREYAADTLTFRREIAKDTPSAVIDVHGGDDLFFLHSYGESRAAISAIDLESLVRTQITTGYRPLDMATNSRTDRLYVADSFASEVVVLQASSGSVEARVPLEPAAPPASDTFATQRRSVAVSERLNRIYVSRHGTGSEGLILDVLDGATNQVRNSILVGASGFPDSPIAIDDSRRRIYIGLIEPASAPFVRYPYGRPKVAVFDADSETLVDTIYLGDATGWPSLPQIAVNPLLGRLYVRLAGRFVLVDTATNAVVASELIENNGRFVVDKRSGKVFVGRSRPDPENPQNGITSTLVLNGSTGSREAEFASIGNPSAIDELGNRLFTVQPMPTNTPSASNLYRIAGYDTNSYEYLGEHSSRDALNMILHPTARKLFVVDEQHGTIEMFQSTTAADPVVLGNISTRAHVEAGDNAMIGGFIITGSEAKTLLIRGIGPSLNLAGSLADPTIEVYAGDGVLVATNDNWKEAGTTQQIFDSGLAPKHELEPALWGVINPGTYTVVVRGKGDTTGVGLVEIYDLDRSAQSAFGNISTRATVRTGDNVMIGGFIVVSDEARKVIVRALGPSLPTAGALANPTLELYDWNGALVADNDDWRSDQEAEIAATTIPPSHDSESAIFATLAPGAYTAVVRGADETTGIALVEAYKLP